MALRLTALPALLLAASTLLSACSNPVSTALSPAGTSILAAPDSLELLTLDPSHDHFDEHRPNTFHGYTILGRAPITDPTLRQQLTAAIADALSHDNTVAAACFNPRHGLRLTKGTQQLDLVICFECRQLLAYTGAFSRYSTINANAEPRFTRTANDASLPSATRPDAFTK